MLLKLIKLCLIYDYFYQIKTGGVSQTSEVYWHVISVNIEKWT